MTATPSSQTMGPHMLLFLMGHCLSLNLDELIEKIIGVSAWLKRKPNGAPKNQRTEFIEVDIL